MKLQASVHEKRGRERTEAVVPALLYLGRRRELGGERTASWSSSRPRPA